MTEDREANNGWTPLMKVVTAGLVVLMVCCALLQLQVIRRNDRLDDLETQGVRIETAITELQNTSERIKVIAEDFAEGDPEAAAALLEVFRKVDAIYRAVVEKDAAPAGADD